VILVFTLQFKPVQNYAVQKAITYLSEELQTKISLKEIYFRPFSSFQLKDFEIYDRSGKSLLKAHRLDAKLNFSSFFSTSEIRIEKLAIKQSSINLEAFKDSTNFSFLSAYFAPKKTGGPPSKNLIRIDLKAVHLADVAFRFYDHNSKKYAYGIDYGNVEISQLYGDFTIKDYDASFIDFDIQKLRFKERSGLHVKELSAAIKANTKRMEFNNFRLETNHSVLRDYLRLSYSEWADFSDFIEKVYVQFHVKDSYISSKDIAYFATDIKHMTFDARIPRADLSGRVNAIDAKNVHLQMAEHTQLKGNFSIHDIPHMEKAMFRFHLTELSSDATDLQQILPGLLDDAQFKIPDFLYDAKLLHYTGQVTGLYNQFNIHGLLKNDFGEIIPHLDLHIDRKFSYKGSLKSAQFDLGKLLNRTDFKETAFDLQLDGEELDLKKLNLHVQGDLYQTDFRNYRYHQVNLDAAYANQHLDFTGSIKDPNATIEFDSQLNWLEETPSYNLFAYIQHTNLKNLKLVEQDSFFIQNAVINTNLQGDNFNNIIGILQSTNLSFTTTKGAFNIPDISFSAAGTESSRHLELSSDVLDASLKGNIDLTTIKPYFTALAMKYAPAIGLETSAYNKQNFDLNLHIKSFDPIASFFDPSLSLDEGAKITAKFSTDQFLAQVNAIAPIVHYKGIKFTQVILDENAHAEALTVNATADRINFTDSTYINNINISNVLAQDSLKYNIKLSEIDAPNTMDLNGLIHFAHNKPALIHVLPSSLKINNEHWQINPSALLKISKGKVYIENLILSQLQQQIKIDGIVSNEDDQMTVNFNNFNLTSLNGITKPLGIQLRGDLNGDLQINSLFNKPTLSANINTSPILYNNLPIGRLSLIADFDPESELIKINSSITDETRKMALNGSYALQRATNKLDFKAELENTDLNLFQPFLKSLVSDLTGSIYADLSIKGDMHHPLISGDAEFKNAHFKVDYLQTKYEINDRAKMENNSIQVNNLKVYDQKRNVATANGFVDLNTLSDPTINIHIAATNFHLLNTSMKENNMYFGTAYGTGIFKFTGPVSAMNMDIKVESKENTKLYIPFNSSMTISDSDFIHFVSASDSINRLKNLNRSSLSGLTMDLDLNLTPDAEVNLSTELGAVSGRGKGLVSMKISTLGDIEMFGDYIINTGKFNFTAQDFINKIFDLKEGGSIRWAGKPAEANVNLSAIYQQRTSVAPLYNAAGRANNEQRVLAQANMNIKGLISRPEITFDLNFPQDPYVKDELQGYLSDVNNMNQQALSLIVRRSFTPASETDFSKEVNSTLISAGTEIAFNQLNHIIASSLNLNFFDLNIRSLNDASASLRLFNDRLIFTGGISDRRNLQLNDLNVFSDRVATDAELSYYLRKDGRFIIRASNRLNTRNFLFNLNEDYVSAVGLVYRQEFDNFSEFLKRLFWWSPKEKSPKESN